MGMRGFPRFAIPVSEDAMKRPRRIYILKKDLDKRRYPKGREGCAAAINGTQRQRHSEACQARMVEATRKDEKDKERVQDAERRK